MTKTTRWWWVRHAPVEWAGKRIYGQADLDADTSDTAAFSALATHLPRGAAVVCSHLKRTHQTLTALQGGGAAHLSPPLVEPDLAEQSFGDWEGSTWAELEATGDPYLAQFWTQPYALAPPGGESFRQMIARAAAAIERLTQEHQGRDIVSVAHAGTIRAALALALGLTEEPEKTFAFYIDNTTLTRIDHEGGNWRIASVGVGHKLPGSMLP
ncbi:MAG: hypothetical protein A2516_05445 [Alphaproteobacteria bacterium RIFOXYD12_FULL_60_8]|nr:MAG: hypothetical protein A2516_05445 [Alphaproteobacteria bacterium RIFOXYD12_FULL_60_8]